MGKFSIIGQSSFFASILVISGCSWVDDTGRQGGTQSEIFFDSVHQHDEKTQLSWSVRDFKDEGNITSLLFQLADEGETVSACSSLFSSTIVASSLRAACQPQLSDEECSVVFDVGSDEVLVSLPELQRPAALRYDVEVTGEDDVVETRSLDLCIASVSESPIASSDSYAVTYLGDLEHAGSKFDEQCVSQGGTGVLENDGDDFDYSEGWDSGQTCLRAELVEGPAYAASFLLRPDGGFRYESSGAAGPGTNDGFKYRVSDGLNFSEVAVVTIAITGENEAPLALNPSLNTLEDKALLIEASQLADDPENTELKVDGFSQPDSGVVELVNGDLRFTPDNNYFGETQFKVVVADSSGLRVESTVSVSVSQVNDAPVASGLPTSFDLIVSDAAQPGEFHWRFVVSDEESTAQELQLSFRGNTSLISSRIVGPSVAGEVDIYLTPLSDGAATFEMEILDQPVDGLDAKAVSYFVPLNVTGMN